MSVNGIGHGTQVQPRLRPAAENAPQEALGQQSQPKPPGSIGVAAMAPPGTDPELWAMLTAEERHFFEQAQSIGPVTYGPNASAADPAMPRGARIDLRV